MDFGARLPPYAHSRRTQMFRIYGTILLAHIYSPTGLFTNTTYRANLPL